MLAPTSRVFSLLKAAETEVHALNHLETVAKLMHLVYGDPDGKKKGITGWMSKLYMPCQFSSNASTLDALLVHSGPDLDDMLKNLSEPEIVSYLDLQSTPC